MHKVLSKDEEHILEKGMKFTPTPVKSNVNEIKEDLAEFTRKIRLAEFFHNKEKEDDSLVRNKSMFVPPLDRNQQLNNFVKNVENIPLNIQFHRKPQRLRQM
ncbi:hypothetical protein ACF0H5_017002 [Mactra antiquata]